jgi:ATP-dependent DNA ligase
MIENLIVSNVDEHVFISQVWKINKREAYEEIVANGGEGVILKNIYGKYFPDKRPLDVWLKVKKYTTKDVVVIGFDESERDYDGDHPETWAYWYNPSTDNKYMTNTTYDTKMLIKDGFVPVKKPWFMGWIGAIRIGQYVNGVLTDVGQVSSTTLNDELKEWFSTHREEAIGKVIEIGAMEQIKKTRKFRHSRFKQFRDDKFPEECIYGEC